MGGMWEPFLRVELDGGWWVLFAGTGNSSQSTDHRLTHGTVLYAGAGTLKLEGWSILSRGLPTINIGGA
jgi:hypothetical protein